MKCNHCQSENTKYIEQLTFSYWYCNDCKNEVSPNTMTVSIGSPTEFTDKYESVPDFQNLAIDSGLLTIPKQPRATGKHPALGAPYGSTNKDVNGLISFFSTLYGFVGCNTAEGDYHTNDTWDLRVKITFTNVRSVNGFIEKFKTELSNWLPAGVTYSPIGRTMNSRGNFCDLELNFKITSLKVSPPQSSGQKPTSTGKNL